MCSGPDLTLDQIERILDQIEHVLDQIERILDPSSDNVPPSVRTQCHILPTMYIILF